MSQPTRKPPGKPANEPASQPALRDRFWETVPLDGMTRGEWEALCDGCALCCLIKLEDEDSGEIAYTDISCRLLDCGTCRCGNYPLRSQLVEGCLVLTPESLPEIAPWLPGTCAYRRLHEGRQLPDWHPLVSGDPEGPHRAGVSLMGAMVPEYEVDEDDYGDRVIEGVL